MRKLAVLVTIGVVVAFVMKKLRGSPAPQFSNHPTVNGGPAAAKPAAPVAMAPKPTVDADPVDADPVPAEPLPPARPAPVDPTVPERDHGSDLIPAPVDPTVSEGTPEPAAPAAKPSAALSAGAERSWVKPVDGVCPDGFPIKAKLKSGIFHQPGGLAYDRTKPDRCYPSVAAAEADDLRPPKR